MLPRLAQKLDALLYRQARSLEEYLDPTTLEDRMQRLLGELFHACLQRQKQQQHPSTTGTSTPSRTDNMPLFRKRKFVQVVGEKRYLQIAHLVYQLEEAAQEIRLAIIQNSPLLTTTSSTSNDDDEDANLTTPSGNHHHTMILNCALVQVFDTTPIQAIPDVPWGILYLQGASALNVYLKTKQQEQEASSLPLLPSPVVAVRRPDPPKPPTLLDIVAKCSSNDKQEQETKTVVEEVPSSLTSTDNTLKLVAKQHHHRQGIAVLMRQPWGSTTTSHGDGNNNSLQLLQRTLKDIVRTRDCVERKQEDDIYKRMRSLLEKRILKIG